LRSACSGLRLERLRALRPSAKRQFTSHLPLSPSSLGSLGSKRKRNESEEGFAQPCVSCRPLRRLISDAAAAGATALAVDFCDFNGFTPTPGIPPELWTITTLTSLTRECCVMFPPLPSTPLPCSTGLWGATKRQRTMHLLWGLTQSCSLRMRAVFHPAWDREPGKLRVSPRCVESASPLSSGGWHVACIAS
jgi:hypothetical protein